VNRRYDAPDIVMKIILHLLALTATTLLLAAPATTTPARKPVTKVTPNATNSFLVSGMHCDACAKGLTTELKLTPGVATARVTFTNQLGVVAFDTNQTSTAKLLGVIREAGYDARLARP
jgi:copper chaperone CopZ